jgi:hypothetical protein
MHDVFHIPTEQIHYYSSHVSAPLRHRRVFPVGYPLSHVTPNGYSLSLSLSFHFSSDLHVLTIVTMVNRAITGYGIDHEI